MCVSYPCLLLRLLCFRFCVKQQRVSCSIHVANSTYCTVVSSQSRSGTAREAGNTKPGPYRSQLSRKCKCQIFKSSNLYIFTSLHLHHLETRRRVGTGTSGTWADVVRGPIKTKTNTRSTDVPVGAGSATHYYCLCKEEDNSKKSDDRSCKRSDDRS